MRSPSKSPSPKKKRLSKNSPIRMLNKKRSPGRSISGGESQAGPASNVKRQIHNEEGMSEGPYYYEAFCFIVRVSADNLCYSETRLKRRG